MNGLYKPRPPRAPAWRFSLRTLFLAVTILASWLGWQVDIIHQRKEFRSRILWSGPGNASFYPPRSIPIYRQWLGDELVERLDVSSTAESELAARLFPEATMIFVIPGPDFQ